MSKGQLASDSLVQKVISQFASNPVFTREIMPCHCNNLYKRFKNVPFPGRSEEAGVAVGR